jgi:hypothetical protein
MKHSPLTIGFASIIPGLGFWLLGQRKRSIIIGLIVFGLLYMSLQPTGQCCIQFLILTWLAQLIFAVQIARTNQKQLRGEIQAPQPAPQFRKPATKLSGDQAREYYSREIARGQLQNDERIIKTFLGKKHASSGMIALTGPAAFFAASFYCVALTQSTLLLIELDFLMKPLSVKRIPFSNIVKAHFKTGWLNTDRIAFDFGDEKVLDLDVGHSFRKQAQATASVFDKS